MLKMNTLKVIKTSKNNVGKSFKKIGNYKILKQLGGGEDNKIYLARNTNNTNKKNVFLKILEQKHESKEFKEKLMQELKKIKNLDHQNIVHTYDYGYINGKLFIATEYYQGISLEQLIELLYREKIVLPIDISLFITILICQAISYSNSCGIPHQLLNPSNILLGTDGLFVKLTNFVSPKHYSSCEKQLGHPEIDYFTPDHLEGLQPDELSNQYSVAILLWELICGRKLFSAHNDLSILKRIKQNIIPIPSSVNPNIPNELEETLMKSLSPSRDQRHENIDALNKKLVHLLFSNYPEFDSQALSDLILIISNYDI